MEKERFEWVRSWCDQADQCNLPRILLIGDSITEGYQAQVRQMLSGVCYVDYLATSYSIDSKVYNVLVRTMVADSNYAIIHLNHGLHGKHISKRVYKNKLSKLLKILTEKSTVILATSTQVRTKNNEGIDLSWERVVKERNEATIACSKEYNLAVNDLYGISAKMNLSKRAPDGVHYFENGFADFANCVLKRIRKQLKQL